MEQYLSWIESGKYGSYNEELGNTTLTQFKSFLTDTISKNRDCLNQTPATQASFVQNIESFFSNLIPQDPQIASQEAAQKLSGCKAQIKTDYKKAKKYNRLLKYLQIEEGKPNACVKANLGVGSSLTAHGFNPTKVNPEKQKTGVTPSYPVYICTGNDGLKKVRVVDHSGTRLRLSPEDLERPEYKLENLPPPGSLDKLLEKLELN